VAHRQRREAAALLQRLDRGVAQESRIVGPPREPGARAELSQDEQDDQADACGEQAAVRQLREGKRHGNSVDEQVDAPSLAACRRARPGRGLRATMVA
jgi:hypothetical protein